MARVFKRFYKNKEGKTTGFAWCVDYWVGKKRVSRSFGNERRQAELYAAEVKRKKLMGDFEFVPTRVPASAFIDLYLQRSKMEKAAHTHRVDICRLARFKNFLKDRGVVYLKDINQEVMEDFRRLLLERTKWRCGPQTFNHYLALIRTVLNKAVQWKKLVRNPLADFKKMKTRSGRQIRYFDDNEVLRILNAADEYMRRVIRILLHTGLRRSELVFLTWDDVRLDDKLIHVQAKPEFGFHTKSDKPRSIPINSELEQTLNDLPVRGRFLFDDGEGRPLQRPDYYTKEFTKILQRAGISDCNLHTLRHTFVSRLVMAGVDLTTVKELAGHANILTTMRYAHLSPDHKAKAVEMLCSSTSTDAKHKRLSLDVR